MVERSHWLQFLAHCLFFLAAWTLFIKYLFPIGFALATGEPWNSHVYWDLWPLAHVWLGWALLAQPGYTRRLAIVMSVIEIAIIVSKFVVFLGDPEWTLWRGNWFVNKVFVLVCFILILVTALVKPGLFRSTD
ncbi:hypothetical protein PVT68_06770 [Microbulbifer bruguierae]|uniref:Uncharacterized protein n=1 Tax=Microbulbifer bruguierae TaxID=3029061 RepID=A0ABY8NH20_9GAMM|nr:hypothetical protein [Microbulbifer bruguierae]WGL17995.1 hypothetical protein PVT68_06770 [Microbulbifer bruguierae]